MSTLEPFFKEYTNEQFIDVKRSLMKSYMGIDIIAKQLKHRHIENLLNTDNDGLSPIHTICRWSSFEMIKYVVDIHIENDLDITSTTNEGWSPIHIICRYQTLEAIKYIVDVYSKNKLPIPGFVEIYDKKSTDYHTPEVLLYLNPNIQELEPSSELDEIISLLEE